MRRFLKRAAFFSVLGAAALGAAACGTAAYLFWLPDVSVLRKQDPKTTAYVELFVRKQRAKGKKPIVMMQWTPLGRISSNLRNAVIIAEDDMFYRHHGVDWDSVEKAYEYNRKKGKLARGASTITQQVARNLYLSPNKNPLRKIKEVLIAWKLEKALSKDRILEIYLNIAEWGIGIYGAQAACRVYFGKNASEVTVDEAVALAAALPSPWRLSPLRQAGPGMMKKKEVLLARMRRAGYLPQEVQESEIEVPEGIDVSTDAASGPFVIEPAPPREMDGPLPRTSPEAGDGGPDAPVVIR